NSFDQTNDARFNAYLKNEPILAAIPNKPSKIVAKYAGTGYATNNENVADIKIFRTAEMYLIRAEARAESGSVSGAASAETDLNALRAARITGYSPVVLGNKETAINEILQERFKELAFEGHRFFDLKRRGLAVSRLASDAPTPAGTTLSAGNFRFLLPIPQAEMLANKLMVQNPGYVN
ncbi:MAG: RagB/SusD family nutrient uptake outer membrane protein, partial [Pedobacter sp.]